MSNTAKSKKKQQSAVGEYTTAQIRRSLHRAIAVHAATKQVDIKKVMNDVLAAGMKVSGIQLSV